MDKQLMKKATVLFCIFLMFVGVVYASYWIYSNIVTVTAAKLLLEFQPIESYANGTVVGKLVATLTPAQSGVTVYFLNVTEGSVQIGTVNTNDSGIAVYDLTTWDGTKYQAKCQLP